MMLASAAHPSYFTQARYDHGTYVSGDVVSNSPALFAFVFANEDHHKEASEIRIVNIGSTEVKPHEMPKEFDG